jgi:hypothetical protein
MLFENGDFDSGAGEKETQHNAGGTTSDYATGRFYGRDGNGWHRAARVARGW